MGCTSSLDLANGSKKNLGVRTPQAGTSMLLEARPNLVAISSCIITSLKGGLNLQPHSNGAHSAYQVRPPNDQDKMEPRNSQSRTPTGAPDFLHVIPLPSQFCQFDVPISQPGRASMRVIKFQIGLEVLDACELVDSENHSLFTPVAEEK